MKKIITGLFAIAAFTFSAVAQTNDNTTDQKKWDKEGHGFHKGHDGQGMRAMEKLNLTDAQKQQMKSINEDFRNRMQALNKNDNMMVKDQRSQRESLMQDRKSKISAILTPEQRTQFEQMHKGMEMREGKMGDMKMEGGRMQGGRMQGGRMEHMKTELGLTDDQLAKMKEGSESFRTRAMAIRENQSLSQDQKKSQFEALQKERENSFKSFLTVEQIAKLDQMKKSHGDGKEKMKGAGWKEKKKSDDGKEKVKVKTS